MTMITLLLILLHSSLSWSASCCGGSFSVPSLILGDDKAQVTSSLATSQVSDDVLSSGKWLRRQDQNSSQTFKLEGAFLLNDQWQAGFVLPLITKSMATVQTQSGMGDTSLYLGHESFPESSYSRWRPRGVSFLQIVFPTSPSVYEAEGTESTDIRGRGFYSLGMGVALTKAWKIWDLNFNSEAHYALPRTFHAASKTEIEVHPGWGFSQTWGAGWNHGDFRLGGNLTFMYEQPIRTVVVTESTSAEQRNFTLALAGSYMITADSAVTAAYSDQSLIGTPLNSSLSKTINLSYQQRWPR